MSEHRIEELTFEAYRKADGVSNSMLKIIREDSPRHLWWEMRHPTPPTEAQAFGALVHAAILTPDAALFHAKPEGMTFVTKEGKAWRDAHQDRPILTTIEAAAIEGMKASVHAHPAASRLLKNADFERSLFVTDTHGTFRKLRPDVLPRGGNVLPDLKSCTSAHPDAFTRAVNDYGYYRQAAYYLDGAALAGRKFDHFAFIAVEKAPPYVCAVHFLELPAVSVGRREYLHDLEIYRQCIERNEWPGPPDTVISLPPYRQKELENAA